MTDYNKLFRVDGKAALVTGGAQGIGAAVAEALAQMGASVLVTDIQESAAAATAERIRATVRAAGGHATLFRGGDKSAGVFQPLAPAVARIHERLKAGFDPAGIFNPGRMY